MMALNPVTGTHRQYVPQNERDIQETRVHSVVHDLAIGCQDAVEKAIKFIGQWTNRDYSQVQVILNTEFSNTKDRLLEVAQLVSMYEKRGLSREVLLTEVRNRNLLGDDFDLQKELALWKAVDELNASGTDPSGTPASPSAAPAAPAKPADLAASAAPKPDFPKGQLRPKREI
jgi:hypothetical protein